MEQTESGNQDRESVEATEDRRLLARYAAKALTIVIRESDKMQFGLDGQLLEISVGGMGIRLKTPLELNEQIKLTLTNEIQRFRKETRGRVRHVTPREDGTFHTGIELFARLTPLEVSMLKLAIPQNSDSDGTVWI